MSGRKILRQGRRRASSATMMAISLLAISVLPISPILAAGASTVTTGVQAKTPVISSAQPLTVSLTTVTPSVAVARTPIRITGRVHNSGSVPIASPVARALIGQNPLTSRLAVAKWATAAAEPPLEEVAHTSLGANLKPGATVRFTLTIEAAAISHSQPFTILPLRVEVSGASATGKQQSADVHTFLPTLASVKAFVPLSIAWLVPLTLDPDPALQGSASPARTAAWKKAIGPGSRLDGLIQGTENANVTWAIDPAILGPPQTPLAVKGAAGPTPSPSVSQPAAQGSTEIPDPVTQATTALAARLKAAAPRHTLWSLPYADPDLAALLPLPSGDQLLNSVIRFPPAIDAAVGPARADIAWPLEGMLTPKSQTLLRSVFASPGLAAAVTSTSALSSASYSATNASHKAGTGLPLLAYDEALSRTVAQTSSRQTGAITIQRFLADSMALLGERPGTPDRSVLIAEPRTFAADPDVLRSLFAAVAKAPWLTPATTGQLLADSTKLPPESPVQGNGSTATFSPAPLAGLDPLKPGVSPLTTNQLAAMPGTLSNIAGVASILGNGPLFAQTWTDAQVQKLSARWRDHPDGLTTIDANTAAAISDVGRQVTVAPSSVNFFADRGVMQVTVVNDLSVPIHDVHLTLTPAQPRLRIEGQPGALKIAANSRITVPLHVTSMAAGLVSIDAVLTTRNGTPLGQDANVNVLVQPPATWIYWVLGGLAGMVLVFGTQRSLRRGSTRASRPDGQEPPFHD